MARTRRVPVELLAPHVLPDVPRGETGPPIVWGELFGNDRPVEVEIGFGKGLFLRTSGENRPDTNFFGVEIIRKYQLFAAIRLRDAGIMNVRVACGDGGAILRDRIAPGSVSAVHIYFPDPWWKARHKKRRVFNEEFTRSVAKVLQTGGIFHIVTDVEEYFGVMMELMRSMPDLYAELPPPEPNEPRHKMDYLTNFERKFRIEGRPIYRAASARREAPPT